MKWLTLLFVSIFFCLGCKGPMVHLHAAAAPTLETGWTSVESEDGRVSIGVPQDFHNALEVRPAFQMDLQEPASAPAPDEQGSPPPAQNPQDAEAAKAVDRFTQNINSMSKSIEDSRVKEIKDEMAKKHLVIWAWSNGITTPGEAMTAFSVARVPDAGNTSLDDAIMKSKEGMLGDVVVTPVTLPIGEARVAKSVAQTMTGDELTDIRYVLMDGGDKYIVRFVASNARNLVEPIADPVMKTLRIKPKE